MEYRLVYGEAHKGVSYGTSVDDYWEGIMWDEKSHTFSASTDDEAKEYVRKFLRSKTATWGGFKYFSHVKDLLRIPAIPSEFLPKRVP